MSARGAHCLPVHTQTQICIIDDDQAVADSLRALLETFGFNVQLYRSGNEFLSDKRHNLAGCLVIDQHMPGLSGLDIIDSLQKERAQIPVILISERLDASTRERASRLDVRELLDKPFAASRLIEAVRTTLAGVG